MTTQEHETATEIEAAEADRARALPAVRASEAMIARGEVSALEVVQQRDKIKQVMESVMVKGVHYGEIPGVNKPTLLKPGAEVLSVTFRLAPSYQSERTFHEGGHLTVVSAAKLTHIPTGLVVAEGEGLCTTYEKKYAYRGEGRTCPNCGAAGTIKKSKYPPRETDYEGASRNDAPGWYCHSKAGGCGANFAADDRRILDQSAEKIPNPDLPDTWNTVLKMANKRALVAAILNGTAASDIFTQDVEDLGPAAADAHEAAAPVAEPTAPTNGATPRSWAEIAEWAAAYGEEIGWGEWVRDAAERLFQTRELGELGAESRRLLSIKAAGAIVKLRDTVEADRFPPPTREEIQRAWASVLDGEILPGPQWRLDPKEADLGAISYYEFHGLPEPGQPTSDSSTTDEGAKEEEAEDAVWSDGSAEDGADGFTDPDDLPFGDGPGGYEG